MELKLTQAAKRKIARQRRSREPIIHQSRGDNARRASRAQAMLQAYSILAHCDAQDAAMDLLTDLRHLGDYDTGHGTFAEMLEHSKYHYDDEILSG